MKEVYISQATLKRLPKYLRILKEKKKENIKFISSTTMSNFLNLNSIQVRKDLALVSKNEGKPGIGFKIDDLIKDIEEFLNLNNATDAVIVGAGKLGQALMNYNGFENDINILIAFDTNEKICDNRKIFYISKMEDLIKRMNIHIGIITVPQNAAQEVCNKMIECGIKAIWNFAPIELKVPKNIAIKNEDLSASLSILLKNLKEKEV